MRSKGINKLIKSLSFGFALAFGLLLVGGTTANAQDRDRDYRDNGQYSNRDNNRRDRDRDNDNDRYNNRNGGQNVRAAFQQGYQDGMRQGRQAAYNRGGR